MAPTLVQASGTTFGTTSGTLAYGTNLTAGNTLLVAASTTNTGATNTVSDGSNGSYTAIAATKQNTTNGSIQWFFLSNTVGGVKPTVTVAGYPSGGGGFTIHEVSGLLSPMVTDGANTATGSSAAPAASVTIGTIGDFVIGYCQVANTAAVGSGFNAGASDTNGDQSEWKIATATGALSVAFTQTSGVWTASAFAALAAATAADAGQPFAREAPPAHFGPF